MQQLILGEAYKSIFFIGIGGIHMSGMATMLHLSGYDVSGSDQKQSAATANLVKAGISVFIGHDAAHISRDIDVVVYTAAVPESNPELAAARRLGIKTMPRPDMLGLIMKRYLYPVCVAGTHGKTTTTSILTEIFVNAGKDPTAIIGGVLPSINGSLRIGKSDFFIVESCEYHDAFLSFFPFVGIILNIELDHTDYFGNLERMRRSFAEFARLIPRDGALIIYSGIDNLDQITGGLKCRIITYGDNGDWRYNNVTYDDKGHASFDVFFHGDFCFRISLNVPGKQNILNTLASIAACRFFNDCIDASFTSSQLQDGIGKYTGTNRRFQYKGTVNGLNIYDDYAHHPTEIRVNVDAAMKMNYNKLWCVFQPHTKKRTKELLDGFAACFKGADYVILLDIYSPAGREENDCNIHSLDLYNELKKNGENVFYFSTEEDAICFIEKKVIPNDMLITMGAGDVVLLAEHMISGYTA